MLLLTGNCNYNNSTSGSGSSPVYHDNDWGGSSSSELMPGAVPASEVPELDPASTMGFMDDIETFLATTIGLMLLLVVAVVLVLRFLVWVWIHTGFLRQQHEVLRTGTNAYGVLFSGADRYLPLLLWKLLSGLILWSLALVIAAPVAAVSLLAGAVGMMISIPIGVIVLVIVMVYVGLGFMFGDRLVALDGCGPMEALKRSWQMADGNRMTLFIFALVQGLVVIAGAILGILALCIGWIVTLPAAMAMGEVAFTEAYLLFTRGEAEASQWALQRPSMVDWSSPAGG